MRDQNTYSLRISIFFKIWIFGFLTIFSILSLLILLGILGEEPPRFLGLLLLGVASWNWYCLLSFPYKIILSENGDVSFISSIRSKTMRAFDIKSIKPQFGAFGFLTVRTTQGKITLLNQFDNFHNLLTALQRLNSNIELTGC
jgi:hypothetical protein